MTKTKANPTDEQGLGGNSGSRASTEPIERRVADEEAFARKLLADRERYLGFTGYADWLDAGCPAGTEHEYPHERIADICFYISRGNDRLESLLSDRAKLEERVRELSALIEKLQDGNRAALRRKARPYCRACRGECKRTPVHSGLTW